MQTIVNYADNYDVDSFEICGAFASRLGGMNGLLMFENYPTAYANCNQEVILDNRENLRSMIKMAHSINKPLLYWHREVMVPPRIIEDDPALLDENGEFNLLGESFEKLLRYKINGTFEAVPDLDGLVLTLTEADFSAIHNSTPDVYQPVKVVEKVVRIFAEETEHLNKRFVLRSFGSIAEDYEDILAGAALAAKEFPFEIETKITPYDFVPFLQTNPFLREIPNTSLCAECDSLGEFLGAGYLPAANIANIIRYVKEGCQNKVKRYAIRLDRIGNSIFNCHEINLFAYHKLIRNPELTEDDIYNEWAAAHWPDCAKEMIELSRFGLETVKKINYIARNAMFHKFPVLPDFQWVKAGGIFAVFQNNVPLKNLSGIWSIMADDTTPGRKAIQAEKDEALAMVLAGIERLEKLRERLLAEEYAKLERVWNCAKTAIISIRAFVYCTCAYFDDMEQGRQDGPSLRETIVWAEDQIKTVLKGSSSEIPTLASICEGATLAGDNLDRVYSIPLLVLSRELLNEYNAEFAARRKWLKDPAMLDFAIPGGIFDDWRIGRYMHASHAELHNSKPVRYAGNTVFPNGFFELELKVQPNQPGTIMLQGIPEDNLEFEFIVDGVSHIARFDEDGNCGIPFETSAATLPVKIKKRGKTYPAILAVAALKTSK
jgi:hypothetical protein